MKSLPVAMLFAAFLPAAAQNSPLNLMPVPAQVEMGQGKLRIDQSFSIAVSGYTDPRIAPAVKRLEQRVQKRTGIPPLPGAKLPQPSQATLVVRCAGAGAAVQKLGEDESYKLEVTASQANLAAPNALGILRGMETFMQLIQADPDTFSVPAVTINDHPRFPWRGLHLDVSRHWMPLDVVLRNLDAMAAVKLNVFHWHLTDDQGFRIESKRFPKLQQLGSDGNFYTQQQVRQVIVYARDRGIRVVPEFDIPGHSTSWLVGYPDLASAPGTYEIGRHWGIFDPTLDPSSDYLYKFLDEFIGEMAALFPDEYFHIGGDEVNGRQWTSSLHIQAFKKKHDLADNHQLQAYFNKRIQEIVKKHGKHMEGWDEILDPALPKDIVIQSWRGQKSLAEASRMGYEGLLSAPYYLDAMKPASEYYLADPLEGESAGLTPEERKRVLGGEICAWAEFLTPENVDSRLWPNAAAVAERFWSPQDTKDVPSMYRRLALVSRELEDLGVRHIANYRIMLERMAGTQPVAPLKILADVVAPVRLGGRQRARKYTQQTPLNRLADTAQPESFLARDFAMQVDNMLAGQSPRATLRLQLMAWRDNDTRLRPALEASSLTQELRPLSEDLATLGAIGLDALDALDTGKKMPDAWLAEKRAFFDQAKKPRAEVTLQIVPAIQKLAEAAAAAR